MFHKGLSKDLLVEAAKGLIEEQGYSSFSMRLLADKLGVKTASLYTHVESMEVLITEVGLSALKEQKDFQILAIEGKHRDDAVVCLAYACRQFAKEHKELYKLIMQMPVSCNETLKNAAEIVTEPAMQVLSEYEISEEQKMHWQRVLRGITHGFVSQEENGYFSHYPVDVEKSYQLAIECLIEGLHHAEGDKAE